MRIRTRLVIGIGLAGAPLLLAQTAETGAADTGIVQGRVYCADTERPARFVHLRLQPINAERSGRGGFANTGADGSFRITGVPPGEYYVEVSMPGYLDPLHGQRDLPELPPAVRDQLSAMLTRVSVTGGQSVTTSVTVYRGGVIAGRVTYDDGGPASGVSVQAFQASTPASAGAFSSAAYASTDDRGEFRLTGLGDGTYTIYAAPRSVFPIYLGNTIDRAHARLVEIRAGAEVGGADIEIPAVAMHRVSGVLLGEDGHAMAHMPLQLRLSSGEATSITAISGADGAFTFPAVPDGSFVVQTAGGKQNVTVTGTDVSDLVIRLAEHE